MLGQHANNGEFEISSDDYTAQARKEMRGWIKLALVVEREGKLYATDALEEALRFITALGGRVMTSTASRLSVVQREIESLSGEAKVLEQGREGAARFGPPGLGLGPHTKTVLARSIWS